MDVENIRAYCLAKQATSESLPFDEVSLVIKVLDKMFAIISLDEEASMNLKCEPERSIALREAHPDDIFPGYHMNKKHWNTVRFDGTLSDELLKELIDHSYNLVVKGMPKKKRELL